MPSERHYSDEEVEKQAAELETWAAFAPVAAMLRALLADRKRLEVVQQQAAHLCDRCGWRMVLPGEPCAKCERDQLRADRAALLDIVRTQAARIAELEAENERLRDIISRPFEPQSVSVPSDVVVVTSPQQNHNFSAQLAVRWRR